MGSLKSASSQSCVYEDLSHKLDESNVAQIKVKERIRTIEKTTKSIENYQETIQKAVVSHKERKATQEISQTKVKEMIRTLEETIKSTENDQETINKAVVSHKERTARQEIPQTKAEIARETLEQQKAILEKEKEDLTKKLAAEQRNGQELKESLSMVVTNLTEVKERTTKLEDEVTQLHTRLLAEEKTAKEVKKSFIKGMLPRFRPHTKQDNVSCQKNTAINGMDELESVIAESVDTGIHSSSRTSTSHFSNMRVANGVQLNPDLKVAVTVTVKGAHMHIPDTGVELDIPAGAVRHKQLIEVTIIPFDKQFAPIENFSCNSSVVVELLPNKARFSLPVFLKLPHCLQLKKNYKEIENHVKVFVSHHKAGPPVWKEDSSAKYTLEEDHCVIRLKQFCWVKYEINDKIVVAKRLKVFTAGKSLHPNDSIAEIEVGYYMDLPGRAENMSAIRGMDFYQTKPFVFVKEGKVPLQLVLSKIVPKEWTYITPDENPKIISYKSIADDKDTSCPFVLEKSRSSERSPYCIFKIVQGIESVELSMRF